MAPTRPRRSRATCCSRRRSAISAARRPAGSPAPTRRRPADARELQFRPAGHAAAAQDLADQLEPGRPAPGLGERRLRDAVFGRRRLARAVGDPPDRARRHGPGPHARGRAGRYPLLDALGLCRLLRRALDAGRGRDPGLDRHGRATLARPRRHPDPTVGDHEDHPGAGAGALVPRRLDRGRRPPHLPGGAGAAGRRAGG